MFESLMATIVLCGIHGVLRIVEKWYERRENGHHNGHGKRNGSLWDRGSPTGGPALKRPVVDHFSERNPERDHTTDLHHHRHVLHHGGYGADDPCFKVENNQGAIERPKPEDETP